MFYVLRTYSDTDSRCLWSVESRPFVSQQLAEEWKDFCALQYRKNQPKGQHTFFVVEML